MLAKNLRRLGRKNNGTNKTLTIWLGPNRPTGHSSLAGLTLFDFFV